ncbi:RHS repeat-associated core domain-containing protein [Pseudomonas sp. zfem004]|nr:MULTISPECIES: RHS repeat-associated core domain-containing protein [unclassified Pseudomonas]MDU9401395.1 RHS repeat-associated core domain-containing protein [Pseudomonas sp. zfem004]
MSLVHLLATDRQRSVLDDSRGTARAYTAYGATIQGGAMSAFCGERLDALTGCYHLGNGHRQFNPVIMRFHSPDAFSPFAEGGLNAYAYCAGDPVNQADPSGRFIIPTLVQGAAFLSSFMTGGAGLNRNFYNAAQRQIHLMRPDHPYIPPTTQARVANTAHFYGAGLMVNSGRAIGLLGGLPASPATDLAMSGAVQSSIGATTVGVGTVLMMRPVASNWWRDAGTYGVPRWRVVTEGVMETLGVGLVWDGLRYLGRGIGSAGNRLSNWVTRPWRTPTEPPVELTTVSAVRQGNSG